MTTEPRCICNPYAESGPVERAPNCRACNPPRPLRTAEEHLNRIETALKGGAIWPWIAEALESLTVLRETIAELERQNKFVHECAVQAHSFWLLQTNQPVDAAALKASYVRWINQEEQIAALTAERDRAVEALTQERAETLRALEPFARYAANAYPQPLPSALAGVHARDAAALHARLSAAAKEPH